MFIYVALILRKKKYFIKLNLHRPKHWIYHLSNLWHGFLAWTIKVLLFYYTACASDNLSIPKQSHKDALLRHVFAVISLLGIVTISKRCFLEVLFVQSLAYGVQSTIFVGCIPPTLVHSCQSIRYGLQSFKGCTSPELLVQSSVYWVRSQSSKGGLFLPLMQLSVYQTRSTIIYSMRFFGIARAVICLLGTVTIIQEMPFSTNFVVDSLSDTVYNHPRDALLQYQMYSLQSTRYGYIHPREAFSYRSCSCQSIRYGLKSFKECVSSAILVLSLGY